MKFCILVWARYVLAPVFSYDEVWTGPFEWHFEGLLPKIRKQLASNPSVSAYVFGSSEPQQFTLPSKVPGAKGEIRVLPIPTMSVVFCAVPVPSMLGITSVQSSTERIVDMKLLKMGWVPFRGGERLSLRRCAPTSGKGDMPISVDDRIFLLHCTMRNGGRGQSEARRKEFEYAMPFLLRSKVW